jgi:hypothetical protein
MHQAEVETFVENLDNVQREENLGYNAALNVFLPYPDR